MPQNASARLRKPPERFLRYAFYGVMAPLILIAIVGRVVAPSIMDIGGPFFYLAVAFVAVIGITHWRRMDEAAREAQKSAWYWGGSAGFLVFMAILVFSPSVFSLLDGLLAGASGGAIDESSFMLGAIAGFVAQFTGFLVAWAVWWLRKR